jgi:SAM-dependent methyltransferase
MKATLDGAASLLTAHGTALYIDGPSGLLRHGPRDGSPRNLALALDGPDVALVCRTDDGLRPVICRQDGQFEADCRADAARHLTDATRLEIVAVGRQEIGLKHAGLFLSAIHGTDLVHLSKQECRLWELFTIRPDPGAPPPSHGPELAYLRTHMETVEGWLDTTAAAVIHRLLRYQAAAGIGGNVLEIGVHHGRLFLLLALAAARGEHAVAVDLFDDQHLNASHSGSGDRAMLERNIRNHAPDATVQIVKANSTGLGEEFVRAHAGMRFVSIDGDHSREGTFSDLRLAERLVVRGGIVALDDVYRPAWSGVTAGLHRYYRDGGKLVPFAMVPNKLLLALDDHYCRDFRSAIAREFAHELSKTPAQRRLQQFFEFDDVLNMTTDWG